jgi:hypothetical protein
MMNALEHLVLKLRIVAHDSLESRKASQALRRYQYLHRRSDSGEECPAVLFRELKG